MFKLGSKGLGYYSDGPSAAPAAAAAGGAPSAAEPRAQPQFAGKSAAELVEEVGGGAAVEEVSTENMKPTGVVAGSAADLDALD